MSLLRFNFGVTIELANGEKMGRLTTVGFLPVGEPITGAQVSALHAQIDAKLEGWLKRAEEIERTQSKPNRIFKLPPRPAHAKGTPWKPRP